MASTKKALTQGRPPDNAESHPNDALDAQTADTIQPPNGECPFTEDDAREVFLDRYDFYRREMKLSDKEAKLRAERSTNIWRREILAPAHP